MATSLGRFKIAQSYEIKWELLLEAQVYKYLNAHAKAIGCSEDLLILPILISTASRMGRNTKIQITDSWSEHITLRGILAARRGERKTKVFSLMKSVNKEISEERDCNENKEDGTCFPTILDESCLNEDCNIRNERLFVIDDLPIALGDKFKNNEILSSNFLQQICKESAYMTNLMASIQAADIEDILNSPDPRHILDRLFIVCVPDCYGITESVETEEPLDQILQQVYNSHCTTPVTYTFSEEAKQEIKRLSELLNAMKKQCLDDDTKRGSINHVIQHLSQLCAAEMALSSAVTGDKTDYVISEKSVRSSFVLCLQMMRQKFLLLRESSDYSDTKLFENILSSEIDKLTAVQTSRFTQRDSEEDVIEITLDGNDEPVARIIPKSNSPQEDFKNENEERSPRFVDMYENSDVEFASSSTQSMSMQEQNSSPYYTRNSNTQPTEVMVYPRYNMANAPLSPIRQKYRNKFPPPLKIRPNQTHPNRRFTLPPKRSCERERTSVKGCVFTCTDSVFLHLCANKIKKCLLTRGTFITSSYACQYRLFPPVPLGQRTSSPRTTHPSWAAIKFFERLESFGLGDVIVFRAQSVKFKKKNFDEMPDRARDIMKQVGVSEAEYAASFATDESGMNGVKHEFSYIYANSHDVAQRDFGEPLPDSNQIIVNEECYRQSYAENQDNMEDS